MDERDQDAPADRAFYFSSSQELIQFYLEEDLPTELDVLVTVRGTERDSFAQKIADIGIQLVHSFAFIPTFHIRGHSNFLVQVLSLPEVVLFELDSPIFLAGEITPTLVDFSPFHESLLALSGKGIKIGLVDSGIDITHPVFLCSNITNLSLEANQEAPLDPNGHGTAIASLLVGNLERKYGKLAGKSFAFKGLVPAASLFSIQAFNSEGTSRVSTCLKAIEEFLVAGVQVFLLPFTPLPGCRIIPESQKPISQDIILDEKPQILTRTLALLSKEGKFIVVPSGNFGPEKNTTGLPAIHSAVFQAGAIQQDVPDGDQQIPFFSGRQDTTGEMGQNLGFALMPGTNILCAKPQDAEFGSGRKGSLFASISGTSLSATILAATITLILQKNDNITPTSLLHDFSSLGKSIGYETVSEGLGLLIPELLLERYNLLYPVPPKLSHLLFKNLEPVLFGFIVLLVLIFVSRSWQV